MHYRCHVLIADLLTLITAGVSLAQDQSNDPALTEPLNYEYQYARDTSNRSMSGPFFRVGGMTVDPQDDARLLNGMGTVETNLGGGFSLAGGYTFYDLPLSLEFEYAFRRYGTDDFINPDTGMLGDTDFTLHTISVNALLDASNLVGPVGVYAGAGIGFRISELRISTGTGGGSSSVSGDGFFWQTMAGVTVTLPRNVQLYGGVRYADGGTFQDDVLRLDSDSFSIEAGVRVYF